MDNCLICQKPVLIYTPVFCCDDWECGCQGAPLNPCVCSSECSDALFKYIGFPYEERRKKAGIKLYEEV